MSRYTPAHRPAARGRTRAAGLVVLGALLVGTGATLLVHSTYTPAAGAAPHVQVASTPSPIPHVPTRVIVTAATPPVRLRIPAIGVDTSLQPLGLEPDGTLQTPSQWQVAGWFRDGVRPGDPGPAVIAGHIDSVSGPAVFYRLGRLRVGAAVYVTRADLSVLRFVVDNIARYRKDSFPAATVYGPQPLPVLRLITCTGTFDWNAHSYLDNLVVSAHLA